MALVVVLGFIYSSFFGLTNLNQLSSCFRNQWRSHGVGNEAYAPSSQNCYALDRMKFLHFIYKILILKAFFSQKYPTAPPPKTNFWLRHCS